MKFQWHSFRECNLEFRLYFLAAYNDHPYPGGPGLGVSYSNDGGTTWNPLQLPYPPDPYGGGNFLDAFDPTATADALGNLYVAHISTDYDWTNGPASGLVCT